MIGPFSTHTFTLASRSLVIQKPTEKECDALIILARNTYSETYPYLFTSENLHELFNKEHITKELESTEYEYALIYVDEKPAGYSKVSFNQKDPSTDKVTPMLDKLYVLKAFQGKGLDKELLQHCFKRIIDRGNASLTLNVWKDNPTAIKFYEKHGFCFTGNTAALDFAGRRFIDCQMTKELTPAPDYTF
ncbi:MAG: GNAT family N-acetyltransferase [Gammaproteobacteria bacterium]|nr:GNAT family N-acetyltransferase [Gammaproteobacteria bacterium]